MDHSPEKWKGPILPLFDPSSNSTSHFRLGKNISKSVKNSSSYRVHRQMTVQNGLLWRFYLLGPLPPSPYTCSIRFFRGVTDCLAKVKDFVRLKNYLFQSWEKQIFPAWRFRCAHRGWNFIITSNFRRNYSSSRCLWRSNHPGTTSRHLSRSGWRNWDKLLITPFQIMPGTSSHTKICLNGKGMKRVNAHGQGNHYVDLKIQIPKTLSPDQKALLQVIHNWFQLSAWLY